MAAMNARTTIIALSALAQESRLAVFRLLVQVGPHGLAATRIGEQLGIAPSSMSFHLKELTRAELITVRREGRSLIYAANFEVMNALIAFLTENCCGGNPCTPSGACDTTEAAQT
jgi:DNA-binding transcriptional ArsR family regulator